MTDTPVEAAEDNIVAPDAIAQEKYIPMRALFVVAHADDIEFGSAGTVARWTAAGTHVTYCIVSDNGSGSDDPEMTRERLSAIREKEQRASAAVCGVEDVIFLGYPDGTIEPTMALRRDLVRVIRRVKPDVMVTLDPQMLFMPTNDYINHPDHRAVGQAAIDAVFPAAGNRMIFSELLAEGLEPHSVTYVYVLFGKPTVIIDTSETFPKKIEALKQHMSQLSAEEIEQFVGQWDKTLGAQAGYAYAEGYRVIKIS